MFSVLAIRSSQLDRGAWQPPSAMSMHTLTTRSHLFKREPNWVDGSRIAWQTMSRSIRSWLQEEGSLTRRLRLACGAGFCVNLLGQHWAKPFRSESAELDLSPSRFALVREVALLCAGQPLVVARTILPAQTLSGVTRRLACLGNRPLGEVLFTYPDLRRTRFRVARVRAPDWQAVVGDRLNVGDSVWGRRSLYTLAGRKLLVCEFFLPAVCQAEK
jgi:chorismate--pyruvate lyase